MIFFLQVFCPIIFVWSSQTGMDNSQALPFLISSVQSFLSNSLRSIDKSSFNMFWFFSLSRGGYVYKQIWSNSHIGITIFIFFKFFMQKIHEISFVYIIFPSYAPILSHVFPPKNGKTWALPRPRFSWPPWRWLEWLRRSYHEDISEIGICYLQR